MSKFNFQSQLISAGAGTGKTTRLVEEVYQLFTNQKFRDENKEADPRLIVCTFTRKASQELKERLFQKAIDLSKPENQLGDSSVSIPEKASRFLQYIQSPSLQISTIDGILNLFLKRYGHRWGLSADFQIDSPQCNKQLFDSLAKDLIFKKNFSLLKKFPYHYLRDLFLFYFKQRLKYGEISFYNSEDFRQFNDQREQNLFKKKRGVPYDLIEIKKQLQNNKNPLADLLNTEEDIKDIKEILKEDNSFKEELFVPFFEEFHQAGKELFPIFMTAKKNESFLDMDDLLLFSLALLRENKKTAQDFNGEWDYWLIDEYQDTSWVQEQIIHQITTFKNVFCVGDPGQSIYCFRDADPDVFQRRKKDIGDQVQKLDTNYRSSPALISFYNDFFPKEDVFIKFKASTNQSKENSLKEPCVYFFTYEKTARSKEEYQQSAFQALYHYIKEIQKKGKDSSRIAILSSTNKDLEGSADYLRKQGLSVLLHGSKNFSKKRLVQDALFLLKFLINPFDDTNLKALLRTPYFRLSDQELVDSSQAHEDLYKKDEKISFWSFIKKEFPNKRAIKSLASFLDLTKQQGYVKALESALMKNAFMDLSYFQDPTGSFESSLWKLLYLLNQDKSSGLELFYSLMEREEEDERNADLLPYERENEQGNVIELMSIHKSKGLEFDHVVIMDFSLDQSSLKPNSDKAVIYDKEKKKMAFKVPEGRRHSSKITSYGHKVANKLETEEIFKEKDRLYYVAMTRAKESLALFIPNSKPQKNSWLSRPHFDSFLNKFSNSENIPIDEKNKISSWKLNPDNYKRENYSLCVRSSEEFSESQEILKSSRKIKQKKNQTPADSFSSKTNIQSSVQSKPLHIKSSKDFVEDILKNVSPDKSEQDSFILPKTKNILFAGNVGTHLHLYLQKMSRLSIDQISPLLENSFLSLEKKKQIKQALIYVQQLKDPDMNYFLKEAHSEWSFKVQKQNVLLKGQIDLWAWKSDEIFVFDYKSSPSPKDEKQLIFYSWILDEIYHPKKIRMYAIYPFQTKTSFLLYEESHKKLFEDWLSGM